MFEKKFTFFRSHFFFLKKIFFLQGQKPLNPNTYATRKTIAQGMLDIALLTANASQLRYVLALGADKHENYHLMIGLIVTSLVLQVTASFQNNKYNYFYYKGISQLRICRPPRKKKLEKYKSEKSGKLIFHSFQHILHYQ